MLRKVMCLAIVLILSGVFGTSAMASEESDREKALHMIEKTNMEIDKRIAEAVVEADKMMASFMEDLQKIEEGKEVGKLKEERAKVLRELEGADADKAEKLEEKLAELNSRIGAENDKISEKMASIQADIDELTSSLELSQDPEKVNKKIAQLNKKLNQKSALYEKRTEKFTKDLDKLINDLYNETLKMSQETIRKAAEKGVQSECSWTLVRLGNKWVWIDPIRVQY